jgi:hypothetical protein
MRVVRELTMERVVASGGLLLHAAALAGARGSVALCGPKRSGKTTLLMALLSSGAGAYVANDRCVLRGTDGRASLRGLPTLVSIRRDTLERFPAAQARLASVRPDADGGERAERPNVSLSPPEFCELLGGCPRASGGPLLALLFPRIGDAPTPLRAQRLAQGEALARLRAGLFRAGHASPLGEVFAPGRAPAPSDASLAALAARVPAYDCLLAGDAAPDAEACRRLLASLA